MLKGKCSFESLHDLEQFEVLTKNISFEKCQSRNNNSNESTTNTQKYTSTFTVEKNFACKYCLRYFSSKESCKNHEKYIHEATDIDLFQCETCKKGFKTKFGLRSHIKNIHESIQSSKFICESCGKVFTNRTNLKRHCHSNGHVCPGDSHELPKRSSQCKICKKIVNDIHEHNKMYHPEEYPKKYKCKECDFQTNRSDNLHRHRMLQHDLHNRNFKAIDKTFENSKKIEWQCKICNKILKSEKDIEDHLINKCKDLICDLCGKHFKLKQHLTRHKKTMH